MAPRQSGVTGITGDKEVIALLRELAKGPTQSETDKAAVESMKPMLDKTVERARPHRDFPGKWPGPWPEAPANPIGGHLDQGLVVKKQKNGYYRLGAIKRARFILHLFEFGTAPHYQPGIDFHHPGARPNPVLLPSYDEEKGNVPVTFGQKIWGVMSAKISRLKKSR